MDTLVNIVYGYLSNPQWWKNGISSDWPKSNQSIVQTYWATFHWIGSVKTGVIPYKSHRNCKCSNQLLMGMFLNCTKNDA